jgi:hypothetical protein
MVMSNCDKIVGGLCLGIVVSIILCFALGTRSNFDFVDFVKNIGPNRQLHLLRGVNPPTFRKSPFKQSWNIQRTQTTPLIGFNQTGVPLSTMPPHIPTPREYFSKPRVGAAAVLPTDIGTVKNALSQGTWAIANGKVRIPTGRLRNKLYHSWGSENLTSQQGYDNAANAMYKIKHNTNLSSPSFQCGNFLPRNGGMQRAKSVCANTPGCIGIIADKNGIPICLKSRNEQQRFYEDPKVDFYEKMVK